MTDTLNILIIIYNTTKNSLKMREFFNFSMAVSWTPITHIDEQREELKRYILHMQDVIYRYRETIDYMYT